MSFTCIEQGSAPSPQNDTPLAANISVALTSSQPRPRSKEAFSLIELIGVMAILAVLAAAAGPTFIKRIDYAAKTEEKKTLTTLTNALVAGCLANKQITNAANMPYVIAQVLNCSLAQVTVNARGFTRLIITDPALSISGAGLPYAQGTAGASTPPSNGRAVIVSTIAKALPAITPDAAEFAEIWNTAADAIPSVLSSWGGRGEDLIIERVNFAPMFCKLLLKNVDPSPDAIPNRGYYSLQDYGIVYVGPTNQFSAYYMDGTLLTLYRSGGAYADRDTREILHADISFLYQKHKWSRRLEGSDEVIGTFGELASDFVKPPAPVDPEFGATQQSVLNLLYGFLTAYGNWAYGDTSTVTNKSGAVISPSVPPYAGGGSGSGGNYPGWAVLDEARVNLNNFTVNLIK
jgi:prepilin-type N-terminal cleavage/methylation domain-containing protein